MNAGIRNNKFLDFKRALHNEQRKRLTRAAIVVNREAKQLLSVSGTGTRSKTGGIVRAVKRTKKTIYGAFPSAPGEPPHKQTGNLRMNVAWEIIEGIRMAARVGIGKAAWYGRLLQLGTRHMKPRPWLDVALNRSMAQLKAIFNAPFRWTG